MIMRTMFTTRRRTAHRGQLLILAIVFFAILFALSAAFVSSAVTYTKFGRHEVARAQALALAEAGIDKAVYELNQNSGYTGESNTPLGAGTFTVSVAAIDSGAKSVTSTGSVSGSASRTVKVKLGVNAATVTFRYGSQAGEGGIIFANNSGLQGNLYSNGNIVGAQHAYISGDAFVAGSGGSISNMCIGYNTKDCVPAVGSAHAHTVTGSTVSGTIYCQSGSGNNKSCNTSRPDPAPEPMPISDDTIAEWKSDAASGVPLSGSQTISVPTTLGPTKISGNLTINSTLTLADTIWVTGDVTINATVKLDSSYGAQSGVIIADGVVTVTNGVVFQDSGTPGSYILLLSTSACDENTSASPCNSRNAMSVNNNSNIIIANAQNGTVNFSNNATVKEVVGKTIRLKNNVTIQYGSGLPNTAFQSGSGGSWAFTPGTYVISD
jgi:hypothetical protein